MTVADITASVMAQYTSADFSDVEALVGLVIQRMPINGFGKSLFVRDIVEEEVRQVLHERIEWKLARARLA